MGQGSFSKTNNHPKCHSLLILLFPGTSLLFLWVDILLLLHGWPFGLGGNTFSTKAVRIRNFFGALSLKTASVHRPGSGMRWLGPFRYNSLVLCNCYGLSPGHTTMNRLIKALQVLHLKLMNRMWSPLHRDLKVQILEIKVNSVRQKSSFSVHDGGYPSCFNSFAWTSCLSLFDLL